MILRGRDRYRGRYRSLFSIGFKPCIPGWIMISNSDIDCDCDTDPDPEGLALRPAVRGRPKPRLPAVVDYTPFQGLSPLFPLTQGLASAPPWALLAAAFQASYPPVRWAPQPGHASQRSLRIDFFSLPGGPHAEGKEPWGARSRRGYA